jgi:hypothetical protein
MTSRVVAIRSSRVIGKKGRLLEESVATIIGRVPEALRPGFHPARKRPVRSQR